MALSKFDDYGGYYSVMYSGIEFARFAPSSVWSAFAESQKDVPDFSYCFVSTR